MARKPSKQKLPSDDEVVEVEASEQEVSTPPSTTEELNPETFGAKRAETKTVEVGGSTVTFGVITY